MKEISEIYRDAVGKAATLGVPAATVNGVTFLRHGVTTSATASGLTVPIPYSITRLDGEFGVVWQYTVPNDLTVYTRTDVVTVVSPYFTKEQLIAYDADTSSLSDIEIVNRERKVRFVIDTVTGRSFGFEEGFVIAYGSGDTIINLPRSIYSVTSVAYEIDPNRTFADEYRILNGGFAIIRTDYQFYDGTIKIPAYEEAVVAGGPLDLFSTPGGRFYQDTAYIITGKFGYPSVPDDVTEAAMMLATTNTSQESLWSDNYVTAISAADWSLEFDPAVYSGTGNAAADSLLSKYRATGISII